MEFCRQELALPSSPASIDNLVSAHNTESDGSLEWLSVLVEDCLSSTSHCLPPLSSGSKPLAKTLIGEIEKLPQQKNPNFSCSQDSVLAPSNVRGKRKRAKITKNPLASWFHQLNPDGILVISADPPLLQQEHWLADSELIVTKAEKNDQKALEPTEETEGLERKKIALMGEFIAPNDQKLLINAEEEGRIIQESEGQYWKKSNMVEMSVEASRPSEEWHGEEKPEGANKKKARKGGGGGEACRPRREKDQNSQTNMGEEERHGGEDEPEGQTWKKTRRCSHCLAHKTPQWREGPMGPKTLCNACGVRYKSGRLLPEYRPARSPTFISNLHSNSHKKVMEMRMGLLS